MEIISYTLPCNYFRKFTPYVVYDRKEEKGSSLYENHSPRAQDKAE